jgi:hypothetical protein
LPLFIALIAVVTSSRLGGSVQMSLKMCQLDVC